MGHANIQNIGEKLLRYLYAKGKASMKEIAQACEKSGVTLHASEGEYTDACSIMIGVTDQISGLLNNKTDGLPDPVIEPILATEEEKKVFARWVENGDEGICAEQDDDGFYPSDKIQFRFTKGWRRRYKDAPIYGNVTH